MKPWHSLLFVISFMAGWLIQAQYDHDVPYREPVAIDLTESAKSKRIWSLSTGLQQHKQLIVVATCPTCLKYDMPNQATVRTLDSVYYTICCSEANTVAAFNVGDTIR